MDDPRLDHYHRWLHHRITSDRKLDPGFIPEEQRDDTKFAKRYVTRRYSVHFRMWTRYFPTLDEMRKFLRAAIASYAHHYYRKVLGRKPSGRKKDPVLKDIGEFIREMNALVKKAISENHDPLHYFSKGRLLSAGEYIVNYNPAEKNKKNAATHCRNARENRRIARMMAQRAAKMTYQQYMDYECGDVHGEHDDYVPPKLAYNSIARMKQFKPTVDEMYEEHGKYTRPSVPRDSNLRYERADKRRKMVKSRPADTVMKPLILEARPEYLTDWEHADA